MVRFSGSAQLGRLVSARRSRAPYGARRNPAATEWEYGQTMFYREKPFHTETFTYQGEEFRAQYWPDYDCGPPWDSEDGHGSVRYIRDREDKKPGERIIAQDRGDFLVYDFAGAMRKAKSEGWGIANQPEGATPSQIAEMAVNRDMEMLSGFAREHWGYVIVEVTHSGTGDSDIVGGVESLDDYHESFARELAAELHARHNKTAEDFLAVLPLD